ncbi:30S ribosomal protein S18 [Candidatus Uhrbacteria bacterium CG_4_9_14_0_2_um_filter_41_50]|uniref:Small ribosomal subunit protein bS18 n=1 Tax=Candidatus Uhrbacteria bacterium CG_4_9_14_0_2_um_filter_41_50 TaxID=1975031 RepID=A0A2M8EN37_9BACT|nr:MAG: 30S ribosomal protein S18 [Candidatus Uhrbacteria bacterium CG_4_10_14_3_um_filter_41_21]PIZ55196.1 MAG: 30S ribosomal protein S18 [Candidatus Uhrbacteria bacterium CG_4_10_14_0_2_um_filter_41_21]PJB84903.1 MAG: 30S ribosomal protein S18 [Candidatus Uhrbacteria bacterium CG_4_9_14_0_8_um_filter_41_16]PJC24163.1 MAG: 30S ribosomal protein S18 [Candidatus Uhrbacteria bacterium CG_4_9_14_0_2_um_filter_41_50]PJE75053.1 MAG: 30S ribosomal protein S18 [Candidatus Uhrbacteria bacterium CG10_bi
MRQKTKQRYCNFCVNKDIVIDYKNTDLLRRYVSSFARIVPRKRSGMCSSHQRQMSQEIKRARIMALLPFVHK